MNLLPRQSSRKPFTLRETHVPIASLSAIILTTLLLGGYLPAPARAEATLLAYYPFEEGTGDTTQDKTERNGSARLMGDVAFTPGKYGAGLEFTGFGDWVDTGRKILDTTHSFSVACWICLADGFDADFRTAVSQDADRVSGFYLQYNKPKAGCAARPSLVHPVELRKSGTGSLCSFRGSSAGSGEWVHLAGVADIEHHRLQLYVNGILAQEQVYDAADRQFEFPSSGHTILGRGRFNGQPGDMFAGKIDEVYLFQGTLNGREVARIRDDEYLVHKPQRTQTGDQPPLAQFNIDLAKTGGVISPLLFGQNLEHTRYGVWHGLSAQLIANHKFAGPPHVDGLAADWLPIGAPQARFQIDHAKSYAGGQAQQITLSQASRPAGLAQGSLPLLQGRGYQVRLALRSEKPLQITVRFYDQNGDNGFESRTFSVEPGDWREFVFAFTSPRTDPQTRLELTFESPGVLQVGMISLLPEDHFHTLRRDVIDLFKAFRPSLLRWPGGNFVRDYVWQQGLLPPDRRPPILSTWRSTLPFTHSYDPHDIGTDEFIELCRYLGAEPCITINMDSKTAPPSEAAEWVEYCNGDVNTHWGKVRAERGHEEPYHVKYWFVGNEVWGHWMGPTHTDVTTYSQRVAAYADAMKKADPSIMLIASGQGAIAADEGAQWDDALLTQAGTHFDLLSQHHYAPAVSWGAGPESDRSFSIRMHEAVEGLLPPNPEVEPEFARLSRYGESEMVPLLRNVRQAIDRRAPDRHMGIVLDEWNVWRNWFTRPYESGWHDGVTEAIYAAGMFHMFIREAEPLGITMALFFQVVNEGGMTVDPYSAKLTPLGQVFTMFTVHQGGRLVQINPPRPGMGLDLCASISRDARSLNITLVNRNPWREQDAELLLGASLAGAAVPLKLFSTPRLTPYAIFEQRTETLNISQDGRLRIHLPRYAVGLMRIALPPAHAP